MQQLEKIGFRSDEAQKMVEQQGTKSDPEQVSKKLQKKALMESTIKQRIKNRTSEKKPAGRTPKKKTKPPLTQNDTEKENPPVRSAVEQHSWKDMLSTLASDGGATAKAAEPTEEPRCIARMDAGLEEVSEPTPCCHHPNRDHDHPSDLLRE